MELDETEGAVHFSNGIVTCEHADPILSRISRARVRLTIFNFIIFNMIIVLQIENLLLFIPSTRYLRSSYIDYNYIIGLRGCVLATPWLA